MKKVFLKAYLKHNLGDDLFVYIISDRYKNIKFESISSEKYDFINRNLKIYNSRIVSKIIRLLTFNRMSLEKVLIQKNDVMVLLGGSLFIEQKSKSNNDILKLKKKPYYIIGANFGPYETKQYFQKMYNFFKKAEDISFRDKYSYDLYKSLDNVRFNPDVVFSMDVKKYISNIDKKSVVISVINCKNRDIYKKQRKYKKYVIDMIKFFQSKNYHVTLLSFCKYEGDEEIINEIMDSVNDVDKYLYAGNIEEALKIIGKSTIVVGSRFHANILGLLMKKVVIPFAYSDKTINMLKDLKYKGNIIDIRKISTFKDSDINFEYKLDISEFQKKANKHFEKLDQILK